MFNNKKLLVAFVKTFLFISKTVGYVVIRLGGECKYDKECQQNDPNSFCSVHTQGSICICKTNYRMSILNNTEKCIKDDFLEEEREGLSAAPIILCFLICVLAEGFCLLAFRYWKKHRSLMGYQYENDRPRCYLQELPTTAGTSMFSETPRYGTLRMQAYTVLELERTLAEFSRFSHSRSDPIVSLTILPNMESRISSTPQSFPPPYSQTIIVGAHTGTQKEESPPSYDEAIKQHKAHSKLEPLEQNHRKLSV